MRNHKGNDGWGRDSYLIPEYAVAGVSDTGTASDSPAPTTVGQAELGGLREHLLRHKIACRIRATSSGNCCMVKCWLTVTRKHYAEASALAHLWLFANRSETRLIHDAT